MAVLAENYISSDHLSRVMAYKRDAQAMPVPECLETAKEEYVNYLDALYYTTVLSAWGAYDSATLRAESAARYLDSLNTKLDEVNACLPNCP